MVASIAHKPVIGQCSERADAQNFRHPYRAVQIDDLAAKPLGLSLRGHFLLQGKPQNFQLRDCWQTFRFCQLVKRRSAVAQFAGNQTVFNLATRFTGHLAHCAKQFTKHAEAFIQQAFQLGQLHFIFIEGFFQPFAAAFFAQNISLNFFQQRVLAIPIFAKLGLACGEIRTVFHATGAHPIEELLKALRIVFSRIISRGFLGHNRRRRY